MKSEKKPYTPPQIFRVELNQEQAILSTCKSGVASASNSGTKRCTTTCRRSSTTAQSDSGPRS